MKKNETNEKAQQHEDIALKLSAQFFAQEMLPFLGINGKVIGIGPTELVQIELRRQMQDFDLIMEDGSWIHFEFQSTDEGIKGLKRFRNYEATASYYHNVPVATYVLYSGRIKNPITEFSEGINTYRVHPIIMQNQNADELLGKLERKIEAGISITKADLVPIVFCLLMGGRTTLKDRVRRSLKITRASHNVAREDLNRIEAVIYTMADKFLEKMEMEDIKEMIKMTTLGEIILRDGRNEGKIEGKIEKLIELINKKLSKGKSIAEIADDLEESADYIRELIEKYDL